MYISVSDYRELTVQQPREAVITRYGIKLSLYDLLGQGI